MRMGTVLLLTLMAGCITVSSTRVDTGALQRVEAALAADDRIAWDKPFDASRKPTQYVGFFGVKSGMTVLDLGAAAGYTSEIFAAAVGPTGRVYAQIDDLVLGLQNGFFGKTLRKRIGDNGARRSNIVYWHRKLDDPGLTDIDLVHWGFNLHDHLNMRGEAYVQTILRGARAALKPGGILAVSDHVGVAGRDNRKLHRIEIEELRTQLIKAGFQIDGQSDLLKNPDDDHSLNVFDDAIYRQTDRVLIRASKPAR